MTNKKVTHESFETNGRSNFAAIYFDMMDSKAWDKLDGNSIKLYLKMRRKYFRKTSKGLVYESNKNNISIPKREYLEYMSQSAYEKAVDQLIAYGFIKVIEYKYLEGSRKVIIYAFSDMWQLYGTKQFIIKEEWKRAKNRQAL